MKHVEISAEVYASDFTSTGFYAEVYLQRISMTGNVPKEIVALSFEDDGIPPSVDEKEKPTEILRQLMAQNPREI